MGVTNYLLNGMILQVAADGSAHFEGNKSWLSIHWVSQAKSEAHFTVPLVQFCRSSAQAPAAACHVETWNI